MIKRKKILLGMTSLVLSVSLIGNGCSKGSENTHESADALGNPAKQEEPIEITIANNFDNPDEDGNFVQKYLEQKFNVKIKNVKLVRGNWREKFSVMLASGQIPDIFPGDAEENDMVNWADQGIIASISAEEIMKYMPNYTKDVEGVAPTAWDSGKYDGKNWGVPRMWYNGKTGFLPAYNESWLNAIGYNEPPKTLAELEDVLTKFVYNDPDGDGKNDTYGITGRAKDYTPQMFNSIFAAFGVAPYQYMKGEGGKLVYSGITENTRQTLKLLNKWYKKGIIDPEFVTSDSSKILDDFIHGRNGMFDTGMWHQLYDSGYYGKEAIDKGVKMVVGKPVTGPNGDSYTMSLGALQAPLMFGVQLEKDDKKRIKILQMLEFISSTDEGYLTTYYGQKGVHYDLQGDLAVLKPAFVSNGKRGEEVGAGGFYNPFAGKVASMMKHDLSKEALDFKNNTTGGVKTLTDALGPAVVVSRTKFEPALKSLQDQYYIGAITGEKDTDKGFDDFVSRWLNSGGKIITEEVNKVYEERQRSHPH
ncbi:extracellular solute-binding protein [Paenibacillus sp. sptzw28]|uniref:extracellular solute-binding protein n=1 Tax=Paenibacillus sp. sptzw28 TaxID=715179 RepID=UPI001C6DF7E0|nr:extracellular solute-binding protein [Paenibacillus sp. sptzw28]QYR19561.1 extracellular solute-binding protein [Paenibacillus sp. sptzw28]